MKLDCVRVDAELIRTETDKKAILERVGLVGVGLQLKFLWCLNENLVSEEEKEYYIDKWTSEIMGSLYDFSKTMVVMYNKNVPVSDKKSTLIFAIIENKIESNMLNGATLKELYVNNINQQDTAYKAMKEMMEYTYGKFENFEINIEDKEWYTDKNNITI